MSVIARATLEALATYLTAIVDPDIDEHQVIVGEADPSAIACYPNLVISFGGAMRLTTFEDDELWSDADKHLVHVGDFSGEIELRLGFRNQVERERIEEKILHAFLSQPQRPGVVVLQLTGFDVNGVAQLATVSIGFALDDRAWDEEMVFESKRFSTLSLMVDMPALVVRDAYDIDALVLALNNDLASDTPTEQVAVEDDGDLVTFP